MAGTVLVFGAGVKHPFVARVFDISLTANARSWKDHERLFVHRGVRSWPP
jgi:hypothetical protein